MKREIKALLICECGTLEVNDLFILRRHQHDARMYPVDVLKLELKKPEGYSKYISSRDVVGIMKEVEKSMKVIMDDYIASLQRRWKGGSIGRYAFIGENGILTNIVREGDE